MKMYIIWAAAILILGVLEGITVQLVSIWFVFGAVAALVASVCGANLAVQIIVFIAVSVISLLVTRPLVKKKLTANKQPTNADRCIGRDGVVCEKIDNLEPSGLVKVDGKIWTARTADGSIIEPESIVRVEKIEGVKLIVSKKERKHNIKKEN